VCKQLVQGCTRQRGSRDSNPQLVNQPLIHSFVHMCFNVTFKTNMNIASKLIDSIPYKFNGHR